MNFHLTFRTIDEKSLSFPKAVSKVEEEMVAKCVFQRRYYYLFGKFVYQQQLTSEQAAHIWILLLSYFQTVQRASCVRDCRPEHV